ncbi:uncharacterized protein tbc1d10c [Symphorus nematophorus]
MLSPSNPAQKTLGEEDSSGSDAGSELGLEPETDRFGFIVTNGSAAGSVGPPPELVRQREAKWINIIAQWDRILQKKTSKVKVQCQKGIPASLRAKCWPMLCGATDKMKQSDNLYQSLDAQPALQSWVDVIERDLDRQFPFHEMFLSKDGHGQRGLFRVLKAYTQYQPEEGYCQAQGPVAAVLLMNMPAEEAFWCLVQISEQYLPGYYSPLLEGVLFDAAMLTWVLKRTCPAAHKHLQHHGVEPLMFATDWLMCLFTRHLPFNTLLRVWDLFFCYGVRVLLQVAAVLVRRVLGRSEQRKQCPGQMETLERLRGVREQIQDEDDDAFVAEVCSVPLSARDLEKQTEKELEKWRKDRPSSTFDPRGRCLGYRMAWTRARQNEEERNRIEREKGNLSVPLARSASTLSLSPSILHKRWRKGGKANAGDWEGSGGGRVVRHLSMGAKEDWRSWNELNFKKVQGVQEEEDAFSDEHKKQSEPDGPKKIEDIQKIPTKQIEETVTVKDDIQNTPTEQAEETITAKDDIQNTPTEQAEETITAKDDIQNKQTEQAEETITVKDDIQNTPTEQVEETITAKDDIQNKPTEQVEETITVKDEIQNTPTEQAEETITAKDDIQNKQTEQAEETITVKDDIQNTPTEQVEETITVKDDIQNTPTEQVEETITVKDEIQNTPTEQVEETITVKDEIQNTPTEQAEETITAKDDIQNTPTEQAEETITAKDDIPNKPTEQVEETCIKEQIEQVEMTISEKEENKEKEESKMLPKQTETYVETEPSRDLDKDQTLENILQQGEEQESNRQSKDLEQQRSNDQNIEDDDTNNETENQEVESEHGAAVEENQTEIQNDADADTNREVETKENVDQSEGYMIQADMKPEESTETENVQVDTVTEVSETSTETSPGSEIDGEVESPVAEETETQQQQQGDVDEGKYHSTESLPETDVKAESHTQTETETDALAQTQEKVEKNATTQDELEAEIVQIDSRTEPETLILCSPECIQPKEGTDAETEAEKQVSNEPTEAFTQCLEAECDTVASEATEEKEGRFQTAQSEGDNDQTHAEEMPTDTTDSTATSQKDKEVNLTAEPVEMSASEEPEPEQPKIPATMSAAEEESTENIVENVQENTVGEDNVFISPEPTDSNTDISPQVQDKESHLELELNNSGLTQAPGRRSSRSSGDFCIRKPSSSRGSRLGRRLSEDLFTVPQKTNQSQPTPNQPEVESQSNPEAVNPTQTPPEVTSSLLEETTERTDIQQEPPKRFGLFRRLRGEQPKKAKMKVPKILIQDFSDGTGTGDPIEGEGEEKLSSRERRRRRRERERQEKEEEKLKKKKEKELEKERRKPQTRGKSFQVQREKGSSDELPPTKTGSQTLKYSASYAESYF